MPIEPVRSLMLKVEDSADRTFGSDPVPLYGIRNGLFLRLRERIILAEARGTLVLVNSRNEIASKPSFSSMAPGLEAGAGDGLPTSCAKTGIWFLRRHLPVSANAFI